MLFNFRAKRITVDELFSVKFCEKYINICYTIDKVLLCYTCFKNKKKKDLNSFRKYKLQCCRFMCYIKKCMQNKFSVTSKLHLVHFLNKI